MAAHGAGRYGCISTQLEFARKQLSHAVLVHDQHYQVNGFGSDLKAPAAADHFERRRSAPSVRRAAGGDALAVFSAKHKSALLQRRGYADANRRLHDVLWD